MAENKVWMRYNPDNGRYDVLINGDIEFSFTDECLASLKRRALDWLKVLSVD